MLRTAWIGPQKHVFSRFVSMNKNKRTPFQTTWPGFRNGTDTSTATNRPTQISLVLCQAEILSICPMPETLASQSSRRRCSSSRVGIILAILVRSRRITTHSAPKLPPRTWCSQRWNRDCSCAPPRLRVAHPSNPRSGIIIKGKTDNELWLKYRPELYRFFNELCSNWIS